MYVKYLAYLRYAPERTAPLLMLVEGKPQTLIVAFFFITPMLLR